MGGKKGVGGELGRSRKTDRNGKGGQKTGFQGEIEKHLLSASASWPHSAFDKAPPTTRNCLQMYPL